MKLPSTPRTAIPRLLSREIRPDSPRPWALPRHHLSEVRTRVADAGWGAGFRIRRMTFVRAGDVCPVREVFVTPVNVDRGSDTFNPGRLVFFPISAEVSQDRGTPTPLPARDGRS